MAWIIPAESDVLTVLSEAELATYPRGGAGLGPERSAGADLLAQVVDLVRGYVGAYRPNTLGAAGTMPQKLLAPALELVAACGYRNAKLASRRRRMCARRRRRRRCGCSSAWRPANSILRRPAEATDEITSAPSRRRSRRMHRRFSWRGGRRCVSAPAANYQK